MIVAALFASIYSKHFISFKKKYDDSGTYVFQFNPKNILANSRFLLIYKSIYLEISSMLISDTTH